MSHSPAVPTGVERKLGADEVVVTKTDLQGRLTYCNGTFRRLTALPESQVLGQPHSIVRHPEMPRAVFRMLWSALQEGREAFAYVVNLASDGAHFWSLVHVSPTVDATGRTTGYHANNHAASPAAVREMAAVYREVLAEERKHSGSSDAAAHGEQALTRVLAARGTTYDAFLWSVTPDLAA